MESSATATWAARPPAAEGANIIVADSNVDGTAKVAAELTRQGVTAFPFKVDVSKATEVEAMADFAVDKLGTLNGIFDNAGIGLMKPFLEMDPATYHKVIDVDQHSAYYGMDARGVAMRRGPRSRSLYVRNIQMKPFMKQKSMPLRASRSTLARAEADRVAIERWEGEGGTARPLKKPRDARSGDGPERGPRRKEVMARRATAAAPVAE